METLKTPEAVNDCETGEERKFMGRWGYEIKKGFGKRTGSSRIWEKSALKVLGLLNKSEYIYE